MKLKERIFVLISAFVIVANANRLPRSIETCGVSKKGAGLIIRGKNFNRGDFPWIVALITTTTKPPLFFCGGTLISSKFVISAAHCILNKDAYEEHLARNTRAIFGAHDLDDHLETDRLVLSPKKITLHRDWNHQIKTFDADLALLEFEGRIRFNDFIQPICLWDSAEEPTVTEGIVTGWGKSEDPAKKHENIPKLIKVPIITNGLCLPGEEDLAGLSSLRTFCAGLKNDSGVCFGDSGGGLVVKLNDRFYLRGIVSAALTKNMGTGCDISKHSVYTDVWEFKDWIRDTTLETLAPRKVFCTFTIYNGEKTCSMRNQAIDFEYFIIGSPKNTSIEIFTASSNKQFKFVPRGIGEKFPNLKEFSATACGLTVVRDFYFKNMEKLEDLGLWDNQIKTIEPKAFDDLVSLRYLGLNGNLIETLDEKLFVKLGKLEWIYLSGNKIKFLSPTTFKIPSNGKLKVVELKDNVCIDKYYGGYELPPLNQMESELRTNCSQ